jgi:hypothetical protein
MLGKIKKFDENLYNKYDIPARELLKKKLGDKIKDNPDIYAEDMIIEDEECKYKFLEIQACAEWIGEKYPHEKPFVFERKGHFNNKTLFILFDKHLTKALLFAKTSLEETPVRTKKYSRYFKYEVQWNKVVTVHMEKFSMEDIYLFQI